MTRYPPLTGEEPCRYTDPDLFFPEQGGSGYEVHTATRLCTTCHVQPACALWGLHHERFGIYGGMTARERRVARSRLGIVLQEPDDFLPREYRRTAA